MKQDKRIFEIKGKAKKRFTFFLSIIRPFNGVPKNKLLLIFVIAIKMRFTSAYLKLTVFHKLVHKSKSINGIVYTLNG